jgi:hypothetical protein
VREEKQETIVGESDKNNEKKRKATEDAHQQAYKGKKIVEEKG